MSELANKSNAGNEAASSDESALVLMIMRTAAGVVSFAPRFISTFPERDVLTHCELLCKCRKLRRVVRYGEARFTAIKDKLPPELTPPAAVRTVEIEKPRPLQFRQTRAVMEVRL